MSTNGKTVLLVEDNEDNRIVYSTILRHFGYSVTEALNGEEGIAKAREQYEAIAKLPIADYNDPRYKQLAEERLRSLH